MYILYTVYVTTPKNILEVQLYFLHDLQYTDIMLVNKPRVSKTFSGS